FLSGDSRLIVPAAKYLAHDGMESKSWPGEMAVSSPEQRVVAMGYLAELRDGWYELHSQRLRFGVRWDWQVEIFPYVWLWQELRGSFGYPWYGRCYVMGVEPFTSIPGSGLNAAIEYGTAPTLAAGKSVHMNMLVEFIQDAPDS